MQLSRSAQKRSVDLLGLGLVISVIGLAGCLKPLPADTATAGMTGSASSTSGASSSGAGPTDATDGTETTGAETTADSSTTYGEPLECAITEHYVCRLDASGQCGADSGCESNEYGCVPGTCSAECESLCSSGWGCVYTGDPAMLVCSPDCDFLSPECPAGTKCMPYADDGGGSWNALTCAPLDPHGVGPGEECTVTESAVSGIDTCDAHSMCWNVDPDTLVGTCAAFCTGPDYDQLSCEPGFRCSLTAESFVLICQRLCDPLLQDCPADDLCIPSGDRFVCVLNASGEAGHYGDPCEYANACKPGLYCLNPEYIEGCQAAGCCTPFCDTSEPLMCPGANQECIPWYEEGQAPPGKEDLGICGVPQ